jgi:hypothetical protein
MTIDIKHAATSTYKEHLFSAGGSVSSARRAEFSFFRERRSYIPSNSKEDRATSFTPIGGEVMSFLTSFLIHWQFSLSAILAVDGVLGNNSHS